MTQPSLFAIATDRLQDRSRIVTATMAVVLGSLLLAASAQMRVEIGAVPITMQSIAAILLGLVLGPRLGAAAAFLYFLECFAIPGFSARPPMMTGGFLLGFVASAWVAGTLFNAGHGRSLLKALFASTAANLVLFAVALPWLTVFFGGDFMKAWQVGAAPFMVAELVKIAIGVVLLRGLGALGTPRS